MKSPSYKLERINARVAIRDPKLRLSVFKRDHSTCVACGSKKNLVIGHIKAVYYGGETIKENLETLCKPCNFAKPL